MRLIIGSLTLVAILIFFSGGDVSAKRVAFTKHNLSFTGPGSIKSASRKNICFFCHTVKRARKGIPALWNRKEQGTSYIPYQSSTLSSDVGQPNGSSRLCLSCHDGTIALGTTVFRPVEIPFAGGLRKLPPGRSSWLGTDLSDDHPVSFVYDSSQTAVNPEIADPSGLPDEIKLDKKHRLQCTSCHDVHDDTYGKFLVMDNQFSRLCLFCHKKEGWETSSHSVSGSTWNNRRSKPWPHTDYTTVAENGCENCHRPHSAGGHERLLLYSFEEDNCLSCHNGNVASTDIESQIIKRYRHPVQDYTGIHDPIEDFSSEQVQPHVAI